MNRCRLDPEPCTGLAPSDEELVRRACAGERQAFDGLIERFQRRAVSVAYRLLGDLHDALEVCQDAFLRAYRNLDTLEERSRFAPWLLRIVTNLSLNYRRARAVGGRRLSFEDCLLDSDTAHEDAAASLIRCDTPPGAFAAASELEMLVHSAIAGLPEQQRTALVLFSLEQMPQKEVAEVMGCSVEAVKWHVFQARKKLKEQLGAYL